MSEEQFRLKKLQEIIKKGIEPYPSRVKRSFAISQALEDFEKLEKQEEEIILVGRVRLLRYHGKSIFAHLEDQSGRIQIYFRYDILGQESFEFVKELLSLGDFIQVKGKLFKTKRGEKTLLVEDFKLISKALLPLPEKWHGLQDIEIRFRKRYLDLIANPQVKEIFKIRSKIIQSIREFLNKRGYLEVQTPILQTIPGGALADPFITHHNALDIDLYLRIAPELYLKRLIIGGFEKVYEIATCFRNEGIDRFHNPEFTQVEFYQAYSDYNDLMKLTENFFQFLVKEIKGSLIIEYQNQKINFKPPYPKLSFKEEILKETGIDIEKEKDLNKLKKQAREIGLEIEEQWSRGKVLDEIFKEKIRPKIIDPTFIIDHPVELSPLAKRKKDNPNYVERFQLIIAGIEICNAFSELNDPIDQEERFKEQEELRKKGEREIQRMDKDFIEALKYGMPPTAGEGIGIDRLTMILTNTQNIKEVILFPLLKPKSEE